MSPNGLNEPPALVATTMLTHAIDTKRRFLRAMAITTAPISNAVVRLLQTADMKNDRMPVIQKSFR